MLFKKSDDLKPYTEINTAVNFESLQRSITAAEYGFIVPVIGLTLYNALNAAYRDTPNEADLSSIFRDLLAQIRIALGPYTMMIYATKGEVQFTDGGVRRMETGNAKTAFQYQVTNLKNQLKKEGDSGIEMLLAFLDSNGLAYPQWTSSDEFKNYRSLFIKTGSEFNKFYTTQSPYRNYMALRAVMKEVEDLLIKKALGQTFFDYLKTLSSSLTAVPTVYEDSLLQLIKSAIANYTIARGLGQLAVTIDENNVTVTSASTFASKDELSKRAAAADSQIGKVIRDAENTAASYMTEITGYLVKYASPVIFLPWYTENGTLLAAAGAIDPLSINETLNASFSL